MADSAEVPSLDFGLSSKNGNENVEAGKGKSETFIIAFDSTGLGNAENLQEAFRKMRKERQVSDRILFGDQTKEAENLQDQSFQILQIFIAVSYLRCEMFSQKIQPKLLHKARFHN